MMLMRKLADERGIAAVTVLLVTAVVAIAGAVLVFSATTELTVGARDRRAESAFTAAEAGLDQAVAHLKQYPTWEPGRTQLCMNNPLVDDAVEYQVAGELCGVEVTSPSNGTFVDPGSGKPFIEYTVVARAQEGRTVTRTLASVYRVETLDIPFGMFVNGDLNLNGAPQMLRESLLVNGTVIHRNRLSFDWNGNGVMDDPDLGWRFHRDLITSDPVPDMCFDADSGENVGCAAVFSNYQIFSRNTTRNSDEIHYPDLEPSDSAFPHDRDVHQTAFDGSGNAIPIVQIPTQDILEPMPELKSLAQQQGLYFDLRDGVGNKTNFQPHTINVDTRDFEKNSVVYIDADADDVVGWKINVIPEDPTSDMKYTNDAGERVGIHSVVIVVRGGDLHLEAGTQISGAVFVPEGEFRTLGGNTFTGTVYAQGFTMQGGGSTVQLVPEWFQRLPAGFVSVVRQAFYECERYQPSSVCPAS